MFNTSHAAERVHGHRPRDSRPPTCSSRAADPRDGARQAPRPAGASASGPAPWAWSTADPRRSWPPGRHGAAAYRCRPRLANRVPILPPPAKKPAALDPRADHRRRPARREQEGRPHDGARHGAAPRAVTPHRRDRNGSPGPTRETGAIVEPSTDPPAPEPPARGLTAAGPPRTSRAHPMFRLRFGFVVIAMVLSRLRGPAGPAPGHRPQGVRRDGRARRASEQVDAAGEARRDPRPQRRRAGHLGRRHDDRRRPADDPRRRAARSRRTSPTSSDLDYFQTLERLRTEGDSRFRYIARRVPVDDRQAGCSASSRTRGYKGLTPGVTRCATTRPTTSRRTSSASSARTTPAGRARAHLRRAALRHRRLGDLRGRRRQPDPARRQHDREAAQRHRPAADHRPRRAVVRPAGAAPDRPRRQRRLRGRGRDGHPHRRAARAGRLPDLRRQPSVDRRPRTTSGRARCSDVYEPGSVEKVLTAPP